MTPTPGALGPDARDAALAAMTGQAGEHELDVLVVGGGITGTGVALDAVTRGLSVGLLEQRDLASGTSSRSSKLIHTAHLPLVHRPHRRAEALVALPPRGAQLPLVRVLAEDLEV